MKKKLFILLLIFQISLAQNSFDKGNALYLKENYDTAILNFENIINSGKQSAEVYFNLGNCYYKLHKIAPAIYNYEKALLLNPSDKETITNLEFAKKMTVDDIKVIPKVGFNKLLANFTSTYHYDTWAWITILLAFFFLGAFLGYYFSYTALLKRVFFIGMFLCFIGIGISASSGFYEKNRTESERPAIVFSETVHVKSEPKYTSSIAFTLHEGTKVYVLNKIANWKKIELTDETTGWIEENTIRELK